MFNQRALSKQSSQKALLAVLLLITITPLSCGKRKAPLPPVEKVSQRATISGAQRGNTVTISWVVPQSANLSNDNTLKVSRTDIYRLTETFTTPLTLSEEEFASRSTLLASVPVSASSAGEEKFSYDDILEFAGQPARLRYAVRFVNESGQKAVFSNFLIIEPTAKVAGQPTLLSAQISQESVRISWNAPSANIDGSKPANIIGYNVYRNVDDSRFSPSVINNTPITENSFNDNFFEFDKKYRYFVRTVSLGGDGEPIESLSSEIISVNPKDTFAPTPPKAITVAAAPDNISIFFAVNPEKDIVGYRIYRSTDSNQPKADWLLLTRELLTLNTFQDKNVGSGETYYYYLVAVDKAGNVSEPSEVVSETAP